VTGARCRATIEEVSQVSRENISQGRAAISAVLIFLYFAVLTAWLPSFVLRNALKTAPKFVADVVAVSIWGFFFLLGAWGLRRLQARRVI